MKSEIRTGANWSGQGIGDDGAPGRFDADRSEIILSGPPESGVRHPQLAARESERFLRIVSQASQVRRHYDPFQLLRGDIQYFIPHQILISAFGDFHGSSLTTDVISALPGVRTRGSEDCNFDDVMRSLQMRWTAHGRQPSFLSARRSQNCCPQAATAGCAGHLGTCDGRSRMASMMPETGASACTWR